LRLKHLIGTSRESDGYDCCGNGVQQRAAQAFYDIVVHIFILF
jgi:hypothetical protein